MVSTLTSIGSLLLDPTPVVDHSGATNAQFGSRWHEGNSHHNGQNF